jgi:hypothetical protein
MALMYPDSEKTRVIFPSRAEEQFYEACRKNLDDGFRVYHSITLSLVEEDGGLKDNEIDAIIYHKDLGIIVVEIKGGRIKYDAETGEYYSINRLDHTFKIKNPFKQVLTFKSRFIKYLRGLDIRVPVSHAVCFPTVAESEIPQTSDVDPLIVIGMTRLQNIKNTLQEIAVKSQPEQYMRFDDAAGELDKALRGTSYSTRLHLRDYLDNHELRMRDIETITETLILPIAATKRLAIEGEAGTGKTMLGVLLAGHFRDQGKSVLFLSSNPILNAHLKNQMGSSIAVNTYADLAESYGVELMRKPKDFEGSVDDWTQFSGPEKLKAAISHSFERYDVLICDEAQDVQPFWWEPLEALLKFDEDSRFYLFFDRSQGVFGSGAAEHTFNPEDVLPIPAPYFPLIHNYRTTKEIASFARRFRTSHETFQGHSSRLGYKPELITYDSEEECVSKLQALVDKLTAHEGLKLNEMTVISARSPFTAGSVLASKKSGLGSFQFFELVGPKHRGSAIITESATRLRVSTIGGFKGLETPVAIVINLSEYHLPINNPIMSSMMYVACTRAKHMCYIFVQKDDLKRKTIEKYLSSIQLSGSLVIEGTIADTKIKGIVTHYNADRVGIIKVEDPGFEKRQMLFFPKDVEASGLTDIKVGVRLIFRPKLEGQLTIASELALG